MKSQPTLAFLLWGGSAEAGGRWLQRSISSEFTTGHDDGAAANFHEGELIGVAKGAGVERGWPGHLGSLLGSGCVIQPNPAPSLTPANRTVTTPRPVESRSTSSGPLANASAVPNVGCPANGNSMVGVKIRNPKSASALGGTTS
jgi:hypothetical protein